MKTKKITMEDIAKKLQISKVSVYKALTNKEDISEELRQKVLDCAIEYDYKLIDPLTKLCRNFYYVIPKRFISSTEVFYQGIYLDLQNYLSNIDIRLEHHIADENFNVENFMMEKSKSKKSKFGVFWAGVIPSTILNDFLNANIPIICIDNYIQNSNGSFIYIDEYHAGYNITDYLIKEGHKRICIVIETTVSTNADKYLGFRKALLMNNIPFDEDMHINLSLAKMENILKFKIPNNKPTAFLFDSDYSAQNFMIAMMNQGYKIPEDFSVASFDNTGLSEETTPKLTSIGPVKSDITRACYRTMLKRLSTTVLKPYLTMVNTTLSIRESVKKIN